MWFSREDTIWVNAVYNAKKKKKKKKNAVGIMLNKAVTDDNIFLLTEYFNMFKIQSMYFPGSSLHPEGCCCLGQYLVWTPNHEGLG